MNIKTKMVRFIAGGSLAKLWHTLAPSFTVSRKFGDVRIYLDFRDNFDALFTSHSDFLKREWPVMELPEWIDGPVWDIGANVGYVTLRSSSHGNPTVAFELSSRAIALLKKSRKANDLDFDIVPRAFLTEEINYKAPNTSRSGNSIQSTGPGDIKSITFQEAAEKHGIPKMIKMDIEGSEKEFFESADWKMWIVDHNILWVVEVHSSDLGFTPEWGDVPFLVLPTGHFAYHKSQAFLDRLQTAFSLIPNNSPY